MSQYYPPPPQQKYYPPPPPQPYPPPASNPYQQYQPYTPAYQPPVYEQGNLTNPVAEKWEPRPKYQDLWALILFLVQFAGFVVLSYLGFKELKADGTLQNNNNNQFKFDNKATILLNLTLLLGFVLSLLYMLLMQRFPKPLIKVTLWLSIATYFIAAAIYAYSQQYILAIIFGVFGIFYAIAAYSWRDRIPFAALMLETVTGLTKKYYGTLIIAFAGLLLQLGYSVWWAFTVVGSYQKFYKESGCETSVNDNGQQVASCQSSTIYIVLLFLLFSFYWTSQVIKNITHVTSSGVFAAYYFLEGTPQGTGSTPTLSSLKRACTTSLGSICFGSLIIAILNTLRAVLRNIAGNNDGACGFVACCAVCLLDYIEALVEYFNTYAFVEVAIFGKSYYQAAKDTWTLIKDRGVEAIINDNLIGNVLTMGSLFVGVLVGLFGYGYIHMENPSFNQNHNYDLPIVIICGLLGLMMMFVVTNVIDSGVVTTFVALAEDPDALRRTKPELFERIRQRWPRVVQGV